MPIVISGPYRDNIAALSTPETEAWRRQGARAQTEACPDQPIQNTGLPPGQFFRARHAGHGVSVVVKLPGSTAIAIPAGQSPRSADADRFRHGRPTRQADSPAFWYLPLVIIRAFTWRVWMLGAITGRRDAGRECAVGRRETERFAPAGSSSSPAGAVMEIVLQHGGDVVVMGLPKGFHQPGDSGVARAECSNSERRPSPRIVVISATRRSDGRTISSIRLTRER